MTPVDSQNITSRRLSLASATQEQLPENEAHHTNSNTVALHEHHTRRPNHTMHEMASSSRNANTADHLQTSVQPESGPLQSRRPTLAINFDTLQNIMKHPDNEWMLKKLISGYTTEELEEILGFRVSDPSLMVRSHSRHTAPADTSGVQTQTAPRLDQSMKSPAIQAEKRKAVEVPNPTGAQRSGPTLQIDLLDLQQPPTQMTKRVPKPHMNHGGNLRANHVHNLPQQNPGPVARSNSGVELSRAGPDSPRKHSTPAPLFGMKLSIPREISSASNYPFHFQSSVNPTNSQLSTKHDQWMIGNDLVSRCYRLYRVFVNDLRNADQQIATDGNHLALIKTTQDRYNSELNRIREIEFPMYETEDIEAQNPETKSRLDGVQFNGKILVYTGNTVPFCVEHGEPGYSGPKLAEDFYAEARETDVGCTAAEKSDWKASIYRRYVKTVQNADAMHLNDQHFGELMKVVNRTFKNKFHIHRRHFMDRMLREARNQPMRPHGNEDNEQAELWRDGHPEQLDSHGKPPSNPPSKRQRLGQSWRWKNTFQ